MQRNGWIDPAEFERTNALTTMLPGPGSTQLAILLAQRLGGRGAALAGGLAFILPAVVLVTALAALFFGGHPPAWVRGAGAGAGAAIAAVAVRAGADLLRGRAFPHGGAGTRRTAYLLAGAAAGAIAGPYLALVLVAAGAAEIAARRPGNPATSPLAALAVVPKAGGLGALSITALKVGALSFGGGFVIIPLMHSDAVHAHHWMSDARFLDAVALGQITPGPVVATIAAIGYAAHGLTGAALGATLAFAPSFALAFAIGPNSSRISANATARAFLDGASPAATGAIFGAAVPLALAISHAWQVPVLAAAAVALLLARRSVVETLLAAGLIGALLAATGAAPIPR